MLVLGTKSKILKISFSLFLNLTIATLAIQSLQAQDETMTLPVKEYKEAQMEQYAEQILSIEDDQKRLNLNEELIELLKSQLTQEGAFSYPFKGISSMTILTPPDSSFRLFNWSIPLSDGRHQYECMLLKRNENGKTELWRLNAVQADTLNTPLETFKGSQEQWPQALYYKLIQKKTIHRTYYTLLAFDAHNRLTKRKWIEVFWFDHRGKLQMGAPIYKHPEKRKMLRPVFRYSAEHAMKMNYNADKDRIEFDFLAPENSRLEGVYEYYFPDVTQDAYRWKDNFWVFEKLIDNEEKSKRAKKRIEKQKEDIILEKGTIYQGN